MPLCAYKDSKEKEKSHPFSVFGVDQCVGCDVTCSMVLPIKALFSI